MLMGLTGYTCYLNKGLLQQLLKIVSFASKGLNNIYFLQKTRLLVQFVR